MGDVCDDWGIFDNGSWLVVWCILRSLFLQTILLGVKMKPYSKLV